MPIGGVMPRFAANLNLQFNEVPMLERYARAASAGFTQVEVLFPYRDGLDQVSDALRQQQLELVLFDTEPGDFASGERGYLCIPGQEAFLEQTFRAGIEMARQLGCSRLNVLAGNLQEGVGWEDHRRTAVENLRRLAPLAEEVGIMLLIEALNAPANPRYFLTNSKLGFELVHEVGSPAVKFQYDAFHLQIMEGNLIETVTKNLPDIGHVQIGDVPGRHEPGSGEINYPNFFAALDRAGYDGFIGLEYIPAGDTEEGLDAWLPRAARANR
jgi:hydroxypyruvate isomerase